MIRFRVGGITTTILAMDESKVTARDAARMATAAAGAVLLTAARANVSLRDHTQADLTALDHPYARRHGSIQIHQSGRSGIVNASASVHSQRGDLLRATKGAMYTEADGSPGYRVFIDPSIAPHAHYVVYGTKVMLPRDVLNETKDAPDVKKAMMLQVVQVFGKHFRTKASARFDTKGGDKQYNRLRV